MEQKIGTESPCTGSILFRSDPMLICLSGNQPLVNQSIRTITWFILYLWSAVAILFSIQEELASWDDWGNNESGLVSIKVESPNEPPEPKQPDEIDLFGDMQPVFQKPKKV